MSAAKQLRWLAMVLLSEGCMSVAHAGLTFGVAIDNAILVLEPSEQWTEKPYAPEIATLTTSLTSIGKLVADNKLTPHYRAGYFDASVDSTSVYTEEFLAKLVLPVVNLRSGLTFTARIEATGHFVEELLFTLNGFAEASVNGVPASSQYELSYLLIASGMGALGLYNDSSFTPDLAALLWTMADDRYLSGYQESYFNFTPNQADAFGKTWMLVDGRLVSSAVTAVAEPTTMPLMALGLISIVGLKRRRR